MRTVLEIPRQCLICGASNSNVQQITLKEGAEPIQLLYYTLCLEHQASTSNEVLKALKQYPDRCVISTIHGLDLSNPILTDPDFVSFAIVGTG